MKSYKIILPALLLLFSVIGGCTPAVPENSIRYENGKYQLDYPKFLTFVDISNEKNPDSIQLADKRIADGWQPSISILNTKIADAKFDLERFVRRRETRYGLAFEEYKLIVREPVAGAADGRWRLKYQSKLGDRILLTEEILVQRDTAVYMITTNMLPEQEVAYAAVFAPVAASFQLQSE